MNQSTKRITLLLASFFAIVLMTAPASANAGAFTGPASGSGLISGSGVWEHEITTTHGVARCSNASFGGGTVPGVVFSEFKLTPNYTGCKLAGLGASINVKTCYFRFTAGETEFGEANRISGSIHLQCTVPGDSITITVIGSKCTITIPPQTIENGISLRNAGWSNYMEILATLNIQGLDYNVDEPTTCPNKSDVTSHTEVNLASYKGEVTIWASSDGLTVH